LPQYNLAAEQGVIRLYIRTRVAVCTPVLVPFMSPYLFLSSHILLSSHNVPFMTYTLYSFPLLFVPRYKEPLIS
jgi:hypothetical protein